MPGHHKFTGVVPPATTPAYVGDHYTDTAAGVGYVSVGTASSADWKDITSLSGLAVTSAARTVLDDASVSAMVDTIFGAASSGTGGAARVNGPTFTAPTLGVASATSLNLGSSVFSQLSSNHVSVANGSSAQSFSVFNVAGTDYSRLSMYCDGTYAWVQTQYGGAGTGLPLVIRAAGSQLYLGVQGGYQWYVDIPGT